MLISAKIDEKLLDMKERAASGIAMTRMPVCFRRSFRIGIHGGVGYCDTSKQKTYKSLKININSLNKKLMCFLFLSLFALLYYTNSLSSRNLLV